MFVYRSQSFICSELTATGLACEDSLIDEDFTILTESLSRMYLLKSTQRKDFPRRCHSAWSGTCCSIRTPPALRYWTASHYIRALAHVCLHVVSGCAD